MYFSFEGIDGSGKSTVLEAVYNRRAIRSDNIVVKTKEPQGIFRDMVLSKNENLNERARLFIYQADRAVHTEMVIKPNINRLILCDRGILSTLCYQNLTTKLPFVTLLQLSVIAADGILPDYIFNFEVSYDESVRRRSGRGEEDHFESKGREFFEKLSEKYHEAGEFLEENYSIPVFNIDTNGRTIEEVTTRVDDIIEVMMNPIC